jgi:hypothetical protein
LRVLLIMVPDKGVPLFQGTDTPLLRCHGYLTYIIETHEIIENPGKIIYCQSDFTFPNTIRIL